MSNYPGYPLPFSTWDTFTPSLRTPFPVGSFHISRLAPSVYSLSDPAFRPPLVDPLLSVAPTSHISPGLPRYLGASDHPVLGLEPLYGFGPQEPPGLLLSPNLSFSQNPSPLTFDQIYRSGASSVSPVSQYRNHFDERVLGTRFAVPGRLSEPVRRDHFFSPEHTEKKDRFGVQSKHDLLDKEHHSDKSVKIWKPFESENGKEVKCGNSKLESSFSIEALTREENRRNSEATVDANGNNVNKCSSENVKILPEKPVPKYPLRPVPLFSVAVSSRQITLPGTNSAQLDNCANNNNFVETTSIQADSNKIGDRDGKRLDVNIDKCYRNSTNVDVKPKDSDRNESRDSNIKTESHTVCFEKSEGAVTKSLITENENKHPINQSKSDISDFKSKHNSKTSGDRSVPYIEKSKEPILKLLHVSLPKLELKIPHPCGSIETENSSKQNEICSPPVNVKQTKTKGRPNKKDELLQLSIQVNEVRNRRNSKDSKLLSPRLSSPNTRERSNSCTSDKVLSPPVETVSKSKTKCSKVSEKRRLSLPIIGRSSGPVRVLARMTSAEGAITMLKNTEDSLSASVSSSHLSESDSDTQLSNDNAEKLFVESQSLNTQQSFSSTGSGNSGYMSTLGVDSLNHDNQYYKPNTPQLCQSDSDNQKPYHCVQGQMFHEKPDVLPPYNCYSTNQSPNVLPREPGFHSQEENSNFPPSLSGVDATMDYDENSVLSDSSQLPPPRCDSQSSITHGADPLSCKDPILQGNASVGNQDSYTLAHDEGQWDFMQSKQYIENIYGNQIGCEIVKSDSDELRVSDSPKTFIDLDKTTKEKKAQETQKDKLKDGYGGKSSGKTFMRPGYPGVHRPSTGIYGTQMYDNYSHMAGNRWSNFNRSDGMMGNQSRPPAENYSTAYEHTPQYRNSYQSNYPSMSQSQNGSDKPFNSQSGYHGNEYNQNDFYNQNQQMKNYQGGYGNGFYQNRGGNEYNSQNNMYPANPGEMQGTRFPNQGYSGGQSNYNQHYGQQTSSHCGPDSTGQYQEGTGYNIPRNASPASTGSDFSSMEAPGGIPKKKRGRKRKVDKEPPDENKPRPNTLVMAPTKIGPLIDIDNPESTIDTYDYNNQIETIFNFTVEDDLSPIGAQYLQIEQRLCQKMLPIKYGYPVTVIYSPLTYAFQTHRDFVAKYCTSERTLMFLGMNPGPYGMSQNGVRPFSHLPVYNAFKPAVKMM